MSLLYALLSFGGGVFAATIGALGAFVFTGFTGLIGVGILIATGGDATFLNEVVFGPFFGPHVSFAAGVAAVAFANNTKKLVPGTNGTDIVTPGFKLADPSVVLVGGVFGILGYFINYLLSGVLALPTDTVALTVVISAIIVRLVFGSTGVIGKYDAADGAARQWFPKGPYFVFMLILAAGISLTVGHMAIMFNAPAIGFVISAATLVFAMHGLPVPGTHHITLMAGLAAVSSGNVYVGVVFGLVSMILGEVWALVFNSHNDTHIDPPAGAIFITTFIILALF